MYLVLVIDAFIDAYKVQSQYLEGRIVMSTNTFDRRIEITDAKSKENLVRFLESDKPARQLSKPLYTTEERERSESLLRQFLSRSKF